MDFLECFFPFWNVFFWNFFLRLLPWIVLLSLSCRLFLRLLPWIFVVKESFLLVPWFFWNVFFLFCYLFQVKLG